jgi:hypothetical protein
MDKDKSVWIDEVAYMWWNWRRKRAELMQASEDELLEQELWKAHKEWQLAQVRLNYAMEEDEIDYAVFMLEATEKRYDMLLKKVKLNHNRAKERKLEQEQALREPASGA